MGLEMQALIKFGRWLLRVTIDSLAATAALLLCLAFWQAYTPDVLRHEPIHYLFMAAMVFALVVALRLLRFATECTFAALHIGGRDA